MSEILKNDDPTPTQRFTGYWIPVELTHLGLSKIEQFLLSMIHSLEAPDPEYCFASNAYLAKQMGLSESRISHYITKFKRKGLIEEVGYDGRRRRLKTCKHNWFKPLEVSNKELCVKTSSQTTRKQVVRLRENKYHITKLDKEDDNKKSRIGGVEVVHKSEPVRSVSTDSIPFSKENNSIDVDSPELIEILEMEPKYEKFFRPEIVARWVAKFGPVLVLETIKFFFQIKSKQKEPIKNAEAWMEKALKNQYSKVDKSSQQNKIFAENIKKKYRLAKLKINKRYCQDTNTGKEYYYHLSPTVFQECIKQLIE